jgi:hypothetical protein
VIELAKQRVLPAPSIGKCSLTGTRVERVTYSQSETRTPNHGCRQNSLHTSEQRRLSKLPEVLEQGHHPTVSAVDPGRLSATTVREPQTETDLCLSRGGWHTAPPMLTTSDAVVVAPESRREVGGREDIDRKFSDMNVTATKSDRREQE